MKGTCTDCDIIMTSEFKLKASGTFRAVGPGTEIICGALLKTLC